MTIVTPPPAIPRDRYGRPMVVPPTGGKPVAYTRATTFIDVLEDKWNLQQWDKRMVALGLASRPDLLLSVQAHRDDKQALNRICDEAKEAAAASAAATTGTALHALTELIDTGRELPPLPDSTVADLGAYKDVTTDLKATHIERFMVLDSLKIGGTPDRVVKYKGKTYIADLKTGSIAWGTLKIASQLAVYSRSHLYDVVTGERSEHGADLKRGIVIHLPAGTATCELRWIDLEAGWNAVLTARDVREKRKATFETLTEPFEEPPVPTDAIAAPAASEAVSATLGSYEEALRDELAQAITPDDVREVWRIYQEIWTDEHTALAKSIIARMAAA